MLRGCGAASFKMVAEFHGKEIPDVVIFCEEAKQRGGYDIQNGWVHAYLVNKAEELGLKAHRIERDVKSIDEIMESLDAGNPVIVSVEKRVLEQKRFHMIVIVGYEKNKEEEVSSEYQLQPSSCFYYHEPESTDSHKGQYRVCDTRTFLEYWRGKAIFITT
jgi:ABC-type bacteriocin/lantibiotic exporter with double-glycine peptidase domain